MSAVSCFRQPPNSNFDILSFNLRKPTSQLFTKHQFCLKSSKFPPCRSHVTAITDFRASKYHSFPPNETLQAKKNPLCSRKQPFPSPFRAPLLSMASFGTSDLETSSINTDPNSNSNPNPTPSSNPIANPNEIEPSFCPPELVSFANYLADEAAVIVKQYFRMPIHVQLKMDRSPVTVADESVERKLRERIREAFPGHGILGEEGGVDFGEGTNRGDYVWVLDPIDGTASFISGKPLFGVLIALLYKGVPVLGLLDQPILKERWLGVKSGQNADIITTFNGNPIRTRACGSLSLAHMYSTSPHLFSGDSEIAFSRLRGKVLRTGYGCDCYAFGLVALGFVDVVVEYGMKPWDYLALIPIVEGAGGVFTDWEGKPLRLDSFDPKDWVGECLAAGDPTAHKEAMEALGWRRRGEMGVET